MTNIFQLNIPKNFESTKINELMDISAKMKEEKYYKEELETKKIQNTILQFIQENERIVYGGFAMHIYILSKSKGKEKIYDEDTLQDVEFYSPTPFEDLIQLAKLLNTKYRNIEVKEAMHELTYTLFVNF